MGERLSLGEIISLEYGKALRQSDCAGNGGVAVMGSNGQTAEHDQRLAAGPGIIVGRKGSAGKVTWIESDFWASDTTFYVVPKRPLNMRWLYHALRNASLEQYRITTGVPGLNRDDAYRVMLSVPELEQQRRIADLLDEADRLQRLRKEANEKAQRIVPALFVEMFGDPQMNPMGWEMRTVGELAAKFSDGPFGSNLKSSHYVASGVRVVRLQNIGAGEFLDEDKAFVSEAHFATIGKHECRAGDVLIGTLGDPNLRAVVQPDWLPIALNKSDCVQLRPNPAIADAWFLAALFNQPATLQMAQTLILGQTRGRIAMGRLRNLAVPVPPLELQRRFGNLSQAADAVRKVNDEATKSLSLAAATLRSNLFAETM
jgi:type I restriction enzyme S subunit